jgi:hypothetical protein
LLLNPGSTFKKKEDSTAFISQASEFSGPLDLFSQNFVFGTPTKFLRRGVLELRSRCPEKIAHPDPRKSANPD